MIDITRQIHTSGFESVKIAVEPKSVVQTSPDTLPDSENTFIIR